MWKLSHSALISGLLLLLIVADVTFAMHYSQVTAQSATSLQPAISPGTSFSARTLSLHTTTMQRVSPISAADTHLLPHMQPLTNAEPGFDTRLLQEATQNKGLPISRSSSTDPVFSMEVGQQKMHINNFVGLRQNCCQPPDVAIATSPQWIVQAVNREIAVYNPSGSLYQGWPKSLANFFGITVPPQCAKAPFVTAPRASYDPNERRFWVVALEDEGLNNACPFQSLLWVAVSQTSNPNGEWYIYTFNMASGTHNAARFTQFALDQQAIYFSANMYGNAGKSFFQYSELFASLKAPLQDGIANSAYYGFVGQTVGNQPVDTVEPVQVQEGRKNWLSGGLFVNSLNIKAGGGHCVQGCNGIVVWSLTHPGRANNTLIGKIIPSLPYALAPLANQPGCIQCFAKKSPPDTRISGTPIYHNGLISFALTTGINNHDTLVPSILWGQIAPTLNNNGNITKASMYQSGYFHFSGDEAALYPSVAVNSAGDLSLLYDYTGSRLKPGAAVTTRKASFTHGQFPNGGIFLHTGKAATANVYWGNYTATSYEGPVTDKIWFSGQFSDGHHNWAIALGYQVLKP